MASVLSLRLRTSRTHDRMSYRARVCCSALFPSGSSATGEGNSRTVAAAPGWHNSSTACSAHGNELTISHVLAVSTNSKSW